MAKVARDGDHGPKGNIRAQARSHNNLTDGKPTATVGDPYLCRKKGHSGARLKNGCMFFRIDEKPVAMRYVTVATCGCRILEGSAVHRCCPHLEAKAKRLAEREMKIEAARDILADAEQRPGESGRDWARRTGRPFNQMRYNELGAAADELERLNRDVRHAEASLAAYGATPGDPHSSGGNAGLADADGHNAPEAMLNLRKGEFRDMGVLPEGVLNENSLWNNTETGYYAAPYYDELTGEVIVAYRGTVLEGSLTDPGSLAYKDMDTNARQGVGEQTEQYDAAMAVADKIAKSPHAANVTFAGHSKGGGLASAAGIIANRPFVTFNPATLSPMTPYRYSEGQRFHEHGGPLGTRYRTHYDFISGPLDAASRNVKIGFLDRLNQLVQGEAVSRIGRPVGERVFEFAPRSPNTHSMSELLEAIEARKSALITTLERELERGDPTDLTLPIGSRHR
jgi:uncharacterized Zn-binding protein involved in type VI secretion